MCERDLELNISTFTKNDVDRLKGFFKGIINSNRRFEQITTIEELYSVLDDRDALTDDLTEFEPNFQKFVHSKLEKIPAEQKLTIPQSVVRLISDHCPRDWENLGLHLKLKREELHQCQNVEDVLFKFAENCNGISLHEVTFRLNRALEKCNNGNLKPQVTELMLAEIS